MRFLFGGRSPADDALTIRNAQKSRTLGLYLFVFEWETHFEASVKPVGGEQGVKEQAVLDYGLQLLKGFVEQYTRGPLPRWKAFADSVELVRVASKCAVDADDWSVFVVLEGCVKLVYDDPPVKGQIGEFNHKGTIFAPRLKPIWLSERGAPLKVRHPGGPASFLPNMTAYAIEPALLIKADYRVIRQLSSRYPQWGDVTEAFLWTDLEGMNSTIIQLRTKDIAGRYRQLMRRGELVKHVSQRDIASYLGITESALSRLVRRLKAEDGASAQPE